jgi:hypothetical protein
MCWSEGDPKKLQHPSHQISGQIKGSSYLCFLKQFSHHFFSVATGSESSKGAQKNRNYKVCKNSEIRIKMLEFSMNY